MNAVLAKLYAVIKAQADRVESNPTAQARLILKEWAAKL